MRLSAGTSRSLSEREQVAAGSSRNEALAAQSSFSTQLGRPAVVDQPADSIGTRDEDTPTTNAATGRAHLTEDAVGLNARSTDSQRRRSRPT